MKSILRDEQYQNRQVSIWKETCTIYNLFTVGDLSTSAPSALAFCLDWSKAFWAAALFLVARSRQTFVFVKTLLPMPQLAPCDGVLYSSALPSTKCEGISTSTLTQYSESSQDRLLSWHGSFWETLMFSDYEQSLEALLCTSYDV